VLARSAADANCFVLCESADAITDLDMMQYAVVANTAADVHARQRQRLDAAECDAGDGEGEGFSMSAVGSFLPEMPTMDSVAQLSWNLLGQVSPAIPHGSIARYDQNSEVLVLN
jgi:hypothetical protein